MKTDLQQLLNKYSTELNKLADHDSLLTSGPASYQQQELWGLLEQYGFNSIIIYGRASLQQPLDNDVFQKALLNIAGRQESLRTTFSLTGGRLIQTLQKNDSVPLSCLQVAADKIEEQWADFCHRPFTGNGLLWRCQLLTDAEGHQQIFLAIHHLIADGFSINIFLRELLHELTAPTAIPLPTASYLEYARRQEQMAAENQYDHKTEYFPPQLIAEKSQKLTAQNIDYHFVLPLRAQRALERICRKSGATAATVLLSYWVKLLAMVSTPAEQLSLGLLYHNRSGDLAQNTIGFYARLLPLTVATGTDDIWELIKTVSQARMKAEKDCQTQLSYRPHSQEYIKACQIRFNFSPDPYEIADNSGILTAMRLPVQGSNSCKLELFCNKGHERLHISLAYCPTIYSEKHIRLLAGLFVRLLTQGERPAGKLPLPPAAPVIEPPTVLEEIYRQVVKNPERTAVKEAEHRLTYGELWERAGKWCAKLAAMGLKAGGIAVTCRPADRDQIAILLAIWRLGAAYLPLDYYHHENRLADLENLGEPVVLVTSDIQPDDKLTEFTEHWPEPSDRAYLIMTSGSTGHPKVAVNTHRGLAAQNEARVKLLAVNEKTNMAVTASMAFDISLWQWTMALTKGGHITILDSVTPLFDSQKMAVDIQKYGIDILELVPSQLVILLKNGVTITGLKQLVLAGEKLPIQLAKEFKTTNPAIKLWNFYGPSECAIDVAAQEIDAELLASWPENVLPIGTPMEGATLQIVDENQRRLPPLCPGELLISGPYVGLGYLNNLKLTAKSFKEFGYLTGDLSYETLDGKFVVLGRKDQQVKLRGYRIEVEEIEAAINKFPEVKDGAVTIINSGDQAELKAILVATNKLDGRTLFNHLNAHLPDYMVPTSWVLVDNLPYLPSGKLNRQALPTLSGRPLELVFQRRPEGEVEKQIAELFQEILGIKDIDANTSFFGYGGSSLLLLELRNRLTTKFGKEIAVADLFSHNSVADLASLVGQAKVQITIPHIEAYEAPATLEQKGIWFFEQIHGHNSMVISTKVRIATTFDLNIIQQIITTITNSQLALKTVFRTENNELIQVVKHDMDIPILAEKYFSEKEFATGYQQFLAQPFSLEDGPLCRFCLAEYNGSKFLFVAIHHLICDGTSIRILTQQFLALAAGKSINDIKITYLDYAYYQQQLGKNLPPDYQKLSSIINKLSAIKLPFERLGIANNISISHRFYLNREIDNKLHIIAQQHNISLAAVLLAIWAKLLQIMLKNADTPLVIGMVSGERNHPELDQTVGLFAKVIPLVISLAEDSLLQAAQKASDSIRNSLIFGDYPVNQELLLTGFNMLPERGAIEIVNNEVITSNYKLVLSCQTLDNGVTEFNLDARRNLYAHEDIVQLSRLFQQLADFAATNPTLPLVLSTHLQQDQIVQDPIIPTVLEQIFSQVKTRPEAAAVKEDGRVLTFRELWDLSSKWCARLAALGLPANGICATFRPVDSDLIAILLACWRLGAAYLPLDFYHHQSRLAALDSLGEKITIIDEKVRPEEAAAAFEEKWPALHDRAYLIFTSGSSGRPKAAVNTHLGLACQNRARRELLKISAAANVAFTASPAFDIALWQMTMALTAGATVTISKNAAPLFAADKLAEDIFGQKISVLELVPSQLARFLKKKYDLTPLKIMVTAGEILTKSLAEKWLAFYPEIKLWNFYGPSECAIDVAAQEISKQLLADWPHETLPIGQPLAGAALQVVDKNFAKLPTLCPGELLISGPFVGGGYLGQKDLTEKVFKNFGYLTGDLAYQTLSGAFVILGRRDSQIKLRGYRLELQEIEKRLEQLPGITAAAAFVQKSGAEDRLAAAVVAQNCLPDFIVSELKASLPDYMIPTEFYQVEKLPYLPSGKLDRQNLPGEKAKKLSSYGGRQPESAAEKAIAQIFAELLNIDIPEANASFLALGGSSLLLLELKNSLSEKFAREIPITDLFQRNSIAELAEIIKIAPPILPPITAHHLTRAPASPAQKRFWTLWHTADNRLYNTQIATILNFTIDKKRLEKALTTLIRRHELLRCNFISKNGNLYQQITEDFNLPLTFRDFSKQTTAIASATKEITEFFSHELHLDRGELWKIYVAVLNNGRTALALNMHHSIEDHTSLTIFFNELLSLYQDSFAQKPLPINYLDYTLWLDHYLAQPATEKLLAEYKQTIQEAVSGSLPGETATPTLNGTMLYDHLPQNLWPTIYQNLAASGLSLFELIFGAFALALQELSNGQKALIAFPSQNRDRTELSGLIAPLLETLVAAPFYFNDSVGDNLQNTATLLRQTRKFSLIPFEALPRLNVKYFCVEHAAIFDNIANNIQDFADLTPQLAKYPITLYLEEDHQPPQLRLLYRTKQYPAPLMQTLLQKIEEIILTFAAQENRAVPGLSSAQKAKRPLLEIKQSLTLPRPAADFGEYLDTLNLDPHKPLAVLAGRRRELPELLLALWQRKQLFVIIDQNLPPREIELLTAKTQGLLTLDRFFTKNEQPVPAADPRAAYLAYTSGTTGIFKEIYGTPYSLEAFFDWYIPRLNLSAKDRFALLSGLGFDPLFRDIFTPLLLGAPLEVPPEDLYREGNIIPWLAEKNISVVHLTPSLARAWLARLSTPLKLPNLRYLVFGGEQLYYSDLKKWRELAPECTFVNSYGLTESPQIFAAYFIEPHESLAENGPVPVGKSRPDVIMTVERDGQPQKPFHRGEIVLKSRALALNMGELLHTGDYGYFDQNNDLFIEGRLDSQIKRSGIRLEPATLKDRLLALPEISDCFVKIKDKELVVWLVPANGSSEEEVKTALARNLRTAFIPNQLYFLENLPLNSHGKVDAEKLSQTTVADLPFSPRETVVINKIREIMPDLPATINRETPFFAAGLDSLALVNLLQALQNSRADWQKMTIIDLFQYPTIARLAAYLDRLSNSEETDRAGGQLLPHRRQLAARRQRTSKED